MLRSARRGAGTGGRGLTVSSRSTSPTGVGLAVSGTDATTAAAGTSFAAERELRARDLPGEAGALLRGRGGLRVSCAKEAWKGTA